MSLLLSPVPSRDPAGETTRSGWGAAIGAACLPAVITYVTAAAVLTLLSGAGGTMAGVARAAAVGWLAAHHVPLTIDAAPLGVLPLLPTLLLGVLIARATAWAASHSGIAHRPEEAYWLAAAIAGVHGAVGTGLALMATPATITADPMLAAVWCALVAGVAAGVGLARPCALVPAALRQAPQWVAPGLRAGLWGLAVLLSAGLAVVLVGLGVSAPETFEMSGPDISSAFGLTVVSIGYLPNAAIAAMSWLAGPGFSIGALSTSPVAMVTAPLPAVPLLAALPQGPVQPWWGVVLAIPLLTGAGMGRRCAHAGSDLATRLQAVGLAAAVLALGGAVLAALAGGRLGTAAFDPVDVPSGSLAVAVLGATLLGGCAVTLFSAQDSRSPANGTADALIAEAQSNAGTQPEENKAQPVEPDCPPGDEQRQPAP
ncbi:MAG: cell division protein PerM [Pseudonocardiaceae bacterium]